MYLFFICVMHIIKIFIQIKVHLIGFYLDYIFDEPLTGNWVTNIAIKRHRDGNANLSDFSEVQKCYFNMLCICRGFILQPLMSSVIWYMTTFIFSSN